MPELNISVEADHAFDTQSISHSTRPQPPGLPGTPYATREISYSPFLFPPHSSHATAPVWISPHSTSSIPHHSPAVPRTGKGIEWPTSLPMSEMLDRISDSRFDTSLPPHEAIETHTPFNECFVNAQPKFGPSDVTPSRQMSQANFNDLLRFTVTVSSSGPSNRSAASDIAQYCREATRTGDDAMSENQTRQSVNLRTGWDPLQSTPNLGKSSAELYQITPSWNSETVFGNDLCYSPDALPLVRSFRAIESAIAGNDKRALKKAVNRLAAVMVNKEPNSETSEAISTGTETADTCAENANMYLGIEPVSSSLVRLLVDLHQSPLADSVHSDSDDYSSSRRVDNIHSTDNQVADFLLHNNQRHRGSEPPLHVSSSSDPVVLEHQEMYQDYGSSELRPSAQKTVPLGETLRNRDQDQAGHRDQSLIDFCKGNVVTLSLRDQSTCRSLQKHLREANAEVRAAILQEALPHFVRLMTDPIGNYFCQTVLQVCSHEDLRRILDRVWKQLPAMSKSLYGTRAVQKLIERCCPLEAKKLLKAFCGHFHDLAIDACGSHVIRQILESVPTEQSDLVHAEIRGNVLEISMTKRGCCAVQKCLDCSTEEQKYLLIHKILEHIPQLIQDPFGNYVIQHVLDMEDISINSQILEYVLIDLWYLSKHKFASNVVERCVRLSNPYQLGSIMGSLVSLGVRKVRELLEDSFGNYVIQSVLETVPHEVYGPLDRVVAFCLPDLDQTAHGRRIAQILLAKFPFLADTPKLYREGKTRLNPDTPTDSSNGVTSDNSMEPRSSTENSRERSSSSSRSKPRKDKSPNEQYHGSSTDNSRMTFTDDSAQVPQRSPGSPQEASDTGQQLPNARQTRLNPHNLSVAINRFRNSRRHQINQDSPEAATMISRDPSALTRSAPTSCAHDPSRSSSTVSTSAYTSPEGSRSISKGSALRCGSRSRPQKGD